MPKRFIPWRLFLVFLAKQPARNRKEWLRWRTLGNGGIDLAGTSLMRDGKVRRGVSPSDRDKQEHDILAALAERKRTQFLH
jgi:hypothetical protein